MANQEFPEITATLVPSSVNEDFVTAGEAISRRSGSSCRQSSGVGVNGGFRARIGLENVARRTLGIILLLVTVVLWTGSNFLASSIFADDTYSRPYFVTYLNTSFFAVSLLPILLRIAHKKGYREIKTSALSCWQGRLYGYRSIGSKRDDEDDHVIGDSHYRTASSDTRTLTEDTVLTPSPPNHLANNSQEVLTLRETAFLSLEFCLLWFVANYFVAACLAYTSVASSTILTSTSSIWTLVFGALARVEIFSLKKLIGLLASLAGIILISSVDLSGDNDDNRGSFPPKSQREIAIGDSMAFFSAVMYGIYTVVMKKRIGNEDRVDMPLFFGMVGLFNVLFLWPGFLILHFMGIEPFELPPTGKIWAIVLANSISSFVSDYCWAYAMLLTTPLVVTVGLSLTIPLSLIGQMILRSQYASGLYWVGAFVVFFSFLFINHESREEQIIDPPVGHSEILTIQDVEL